MQRASAEVGPEASTLEAIPTSMEGFEVIARIGSEVVLAREVMWTANVVLEKLRGQIPPQAVPLKRTELIAQQLMSMLDMRMAYADFRQNAPQADLEGIHANLARQFEEKEIPRLMKQVGVEDPRKLEARLVQLGTSLREREEDFQKIAIARSWIGQDLKYDQEVTHDNMLEYYHAHLADYEFPTQAKWEEIMIRHDKYASKADAYRETAKIGNRVFRNLKGKASDQPIFSDVAKEVSDGFTAENGGLHDWTTQGSLTAECIDEALFSLPIGEMSPILESDVGFHLVRVLERKEAGREPFTDVQNAISEKIRDERFHEAIDGKLNELRRKSRIWTIFTGDIDPIEYAAARDAASKR